MTTQLIRLDFISVALLSVTFTDIDCLLKIAASITVITINVLTYKKLKNKK